MLEAIFSAPRRSAGTRKAARRYVAEHKRAGDWPGRAKALEAVRTRAAQDGAPGTGKRTAPVRMVSPGAPSVGVGSGLPAASPLPDMTHDNAALQLAIAITRRVPGSEAIHGRDLVRDIGNILRRAGALPEPGDGSGATFMRKLAMIGWSDAERELVRALDTAVAAGELPDVEDIRDARFDAFAELGGIGGAPVEPHVMAGRLSANFTRSEIRALSDPSGELPANLRHIGTAVRSGFAAWIREWMPEQGKEPMPGRTPVAERRQEVAGTVAPQTAVTPRDSDDRLRDRVMQLAAALTERIVPTRGIHGRDMKRQVKEALLLPSDAVPEGDIVRLAGGIARRRVEADIRVELVSSMSSAPVYEANARFRGSPKLHRSDLRQRYGEELPKRLAGLESGGDTPTELEREVARVALAARGTPCERLADAMADALGFGSVSDVGELRRERDRLLRTLAEPVGRLKTSVRRDLVRRMHRAFTGSEILALAESRARSVVPEADRGQVAESVRLLLSTRIADPAPWRGQHEQLGRTTGAVLTREAGMGIEPF